MALSRSINLAIVYCLFLLLAARTVMRLLLLPIPSLGRNYAMCSKWKHHQIAADNMEALAGLSLSSLIGQNGSPKSSHARVPSSCIYWLNVWAREYIVPQWSSKRINLQPLFGRQHGGRAISNVGCRSYISFSGIESRRFPKCTHYSPFSLPSPEIAGKHNLVICIC